MADSGITKKALAEAMLIVAEDKLLSGVTISDICEKCFMNRKSFYYHFKDKYDLVNWIFDNDISKLDLANELGEFLTGVFSVLDQRRKFYRQAFLIEGQNSFKDHFASIVLPPVLSKIEDENFKKFYSVFLGDGVTGIVKRWLDLEFEASPEELSEDIKRAVFDIICE